MRKRSHKDISQPPAGDINRPLEALPEPRTGEDAQANAAAQEAEAQELYQYVRAAVANTSDGIIVLNQHFQVRAFNEAVTAALGWEREKVIGRGCAEVLKCRNLNHMALCGTSACPLVRVLHYQHALPNEELIIGEAPEGRCEVSASVTPVDVGQGMHVVFSVRDVSALKIANRVRANFVSMVSHELRTPLNSVQGFIDLMLMGHMGPLGEEQQKYLGYAQEGVQQLVAIVEDILFMTRSDSGQFEMRQQKVNSRVLAKQVVTSLQFQAQKAEVILQKEIPTPTPLLYADPQRLKQVLNNLVINAIKFTPPSKSVTISVRPYDERMALVSVSDMGFGIPLEDRQHVFERFYQANHILQSKMGGYGLGLTIARLIVEQHGGSIWFETALDQGTTFYFTTPLYKGQPVDEAPDQN